MSENPIQAILKTFDSFAHGFQAHLSHLFSDLQTSSSSSSIRSRAPKPFPPDESAILQSVADLSGPASLAKKKSVTPLTKEELGRATWTLLHGIAAQFPDQPTRQQKRDAKELAVGLIDWLAFSIRWSLLVILEPTRWICGSGPKIANPTKEKGPIDGINN